MIRTGKIDYYACVSFDTLPEYFALRLWLEDENGVPLCQPMLWLERLGDDSGFEEKDPDDFSGSTVLNFGGTGFGVLLDSVREVTGSGGDGARVAKFEVERAGDLLVKGINIHMDPTSGTQMCADLTVVNESETAIRCIPTLKTTGNLPVTFFWSTDPNGTDKSKELTQIEIAPNDSATRQFYLFAVWPDEAAAKSFEYHREIDHVQVTLSCEQID